MTGQEDVLHYRTATIDDLEEVVAANIAMAKVRRHFCLHVLASAVGKARLQRERSSSSSSIVDSSMCSSCKPALFNGLFADSIGSCCAGDGGY
jgi:hypothetical protein